MDTCIRFLGGIILIFSLLTVSGCSHYATDTEGVMGETEIQQINTIESQQDSTVKVTLFYESLCPYCIGFFTHQLKPTYQILSEHLVIDLVPYGNAKRSFVHGHWNFSCQHGVKECDYNKIHGCAIHLLNKDTSVKFITCLMQDSEEDAHLEKCATEHNVPLKSINVCRQSAEGDNLLAEMGKRTDDFKPAIQGVPTVAFNGIYTEKDEDDALTNLTKVVCRHLKPKPKVCLKHILGEDN